VETTGKPIFFETVPDKKPRTECGCQPVAFINSLAVAPSGRFSRSRTLAALLPFLAPLPFVAPLGAFLAEVAFFPGLAFFGATVRARLALVVFWVAFGASAAGPRRFPLLLRSRS